jgi:hypothetical protein
VFAILDLISGLDFKVALIQHAINEASLKPTSTTHFVSPFIGTILPLRFLIYGGDILRNKQRFKSTEVMVLRNLVG